MDFFEKHRAFLQRHTALLLDSHRRITGRELLGRSGDAAEDAGRLFAAPFVVVSGGTEGDQILNYGNAAALQLWEMDWDTLVRTPSRLTAEPMHRAERAAFLARVREHGFVDDYSGIRISKNGRRFRIRQATVWNLVDSTGAFAGQAATFGSWEFLGD